MRYEKEVHWRKFLKRNKNM